jgi:hypothetical protein
MLPIARRPQQTPGSGTLILVKAGLKTPIQFLATSMLLKSVTMNDAIKTGAGRAVGYWNGNSAEDLLFELCRIRNLLATEKSRDRIVPGNIPHRGQVPNDLLDCRSYPLWGCDKKGSCVVGPAANRIEALEKVRFVSKYKKNVEVCSQESFLSEECTKIISELAEHKSFVS